jgi:glycosyltransferase involved in cell wall biosynthesis
MLTMRYRNIALWLNCHGFRNDFYRPDQTYDVVVVIKSFHQEVLDEVNRLKRKGTPLVFDANVNYYTIWGKYTDPYTHPTPDLQRSAIQITRLADHVIADSEYIRDVVGDFNPNVTWIPDNVLPLLFRSAKHSAQAGKLRLIWSGVAFKSNELALIKQALAAVKGVELWLVSDSRPPVLDELEGVIPLRWFHYSDVAYARQLGKADVIISPRDLNNGYNLGHTEYKIMLGMARCLPALASPQPAYVTAIQRGGGGIICYNLDEWIAALGYLRDYPDARLEMGQRARQTMENYYATPVVAAQFADVLRRVIKERD